MGMIKIQNRTHQELTEIGRKIGEAFAAEQSGVVTMLPKEHIVKTFEIMTEFYYNLGALYTISEKEEAFLAFWRKNQKIPLRPAARVIKRMLFEVPFSSCLMIAPTGSEQFRKIYKKEKDYVAVSMVVVLREFQGKGLMHQVLKEPFFIAAQNKIPCVLDTDTELKVAKYMRCGMKLVKSKKRKKGLALYTMEYRTSLT